MKVRFRLRIKCIDESIARKLEMVLSPDNRAIPRDQEFSMKRDSSYISFYIASPRPKSALSSLESVLYDIGLFREVWLLSNQYKERGGKELSHA